MLRSGIVKEWATSNGRSSSRAPQERRTILESAVNRPIANPTFPVLASGQVPSAGTQLDSLAGRAVASQRVAKSLRAMSLAYCFVGEARAAATGALCNPV